MSPSAEDFFLFHFHSKSRMLLAGSYERNERRRTKNKERRKDTPKNGKSPLQTALVNKNGGKGLHGEHRGFFYSRRLRFYLISLCCCCCLARYAHSSALFVLLLCFCSFKALKYSRSLVGWYGCHSWLNEPDQILTPAEILTPISRGTNRNYSCAQKHPSLQSKHTHPDIS